jgi:ComF family protein
MQSLFQFLLPTSCTLCGIKAELGICKACRADFLACAVHRCEKCALPIFTKQTKLCGACLSDPPYFDTTIACTDYQAPIDSIVLGLKFGGKLAQATSIAQLLGEVICQQREIGIEMPSLLCPVPLSRQRLISRGFNQAMEIARPISQQLGIPLYADLLWRVKNTQPQSQLHPDQRQRNVKNAFSIHPDLIHMISGQHIGVIDDVMTTGTTLNEAAKLLKRFGAMRVSNFVFARTNRH